MNIRSKDVHELVDQCRRWAKMEMRSQSTDEVVQQIEHFVEEFDYLSHEYMICSAWCRLAAGYLRGEDVPESIYPAEDEDPNDTFRWQQWRVQ